MQPRRKLSLQEDMSMFRKRALTDIKKLEDIKEGDESEEKESVKHINANEETEPRPPELHQVCLDGNIELLKELIDNGADMNVLDESGWPPLHTAIRSGKSECAALLIKMGAGEFYYNKQKEDYLKRLENSKKTRKISYWR